MAMSLFQHLEQHAARQPEASAVVEHRDDGQTLTVTWRQYHNAIAAFAQSLRKAAAPGQVVLLIAPNRTQTMIAFFAALLADVAVYPLSPHLSEHERIEAARRSGATACIGLPEATACLEGVVTTRIALNAVPLVGDDAAAAASMDAHKGTARLLLQSSGTTGLPKIVSRELAGVVAMGDSCRRHVGVTSDDRMLAVVPVCHSYGIDHELLSAMLAGATVVLCPRFDAAQVHTLLKRDEVSIFPGVPFIFDALAKFADAPMKPGRLRRAFSAGGPLPASVFDAFSEKYSLRLGQIYGSTEFGSITYNDPDITPFDHASAGRPMDNLTLRILDREHPRADAPLTTGEEGQLAVAAPSMLTRYIGHDESPLTDGLFHVGDLARVDAQGRLFITGRVKLLIEVGGLKVNPLEVEAVLSQHPAVSDVVVVGVPLSETITRVKAIVVWKGNGGEGDMDSLRRFARERLASYKVPRIFEERTSLPKSATGKILRGELQPT